MLMLELHVLLLLLLLQPSLQRVGQPEQLGLHRHAVHAALLRRRRRHHHVEVVHELRRVRVQRDVRPPAARGRRPLLRGPHLPDRAALQLLRREDVLGLGLEGRG